MLVLLHSLRLFSLSAHSNLPISSYYFVSFSSFHSIFHDQCRSVYCNCNFTLSFIHTVTLTHAALCNVSLPLQTPEGSISLLRTLEVFAALRVVSIVQRCPFIPVAFPSRAHPPLPPSPPPPHPPPTPSASSPAEQQQGPCLGD